MKLIWNRSVIVNLIILLMTMICLRYQIQSRDISKEMSTEVDLLCAHLQSIFFKESQKNSVSIQSRKDGGFLGTKQKVVSILCLKQFKAGGVACYRVILYTF